MSSSLHTLSIVNQRAPFTPQPGPHKQELWFTVPTPRSNRYHLLLISLVSATLPRACQPITNQAATVGMSLPQSVSARDPEEGIRVLRSGLFLHHMPAFTPGNLLWLSNQTHAPTQTCPSPKHPCLSERSSQDSARSQASFRLSRHDARSSGTVAVSSSFLLPFYSSFHSPAPNTTALDHNVWPKHHGRQGLTYGSSYPSPG